MPLLPCKCPNCGAELEVDKSNEAAICKYCNTPFIVEKAINNYNINNNFAGANIIMEDGVTLENLYTLARRALKKEQFEDALNYYNDILKKAPNDWEAIFFADYCLYFSDHKTDLDFKAIAENVANVISESVDRIKNQITDDNEQKSAITTLSPYCLNWFSAIISKFAIMNRVPIRGISDPHEVRFGTTYKMQYPKDFLNDVIRLMAIGYSFGDALENNNFSDALINDTKVKAWKKSLEININTYNSCMDSDLKQKDLAFFFRFLAVDKTIKANQMRKHCVGEYINGYHIFEYLNKRFINKYIDKIKQYEPDYVPIAFGEDDDLKENLINKYINEVKKDDPNFEPLPIKEVKGCYVATCVYGSYDCPEVWTLRRFRDNYLSTRWYGKLFVKMYYLISPHIVESFGENKFFKKMWKTNLDKLVAKLQKSGYLNTPYSDK